MLWLWWVFSFIIIDDEKKNVYGETPLKFFPVHRAVNVRDEKGVIMFVFSLSFNITLQTVEKNSFQFTSVAPENQRPTRSYLLNI